MNTASIGHVEWGTPDPATLRTFLAQMFGWEFQALTSQYLMYIPASGGVSVGINQSEQLRAGVRLYFRSRWKHHRLADAVDMFTIAVFSTTTPTDTACTRRFAARRSARASGSRGSRR